MMYYAGFKLSAVAGLGTLTLGTSGKSNLVITLGTMTENDADGSATSLMFHAPAGPAYTAEDGSGSSRLREYAVAHFSEVLEAAIRVAATSATWTTPNGLTVTIAEATGIITFAYSVQNFTLTWSTAAGRAMCGFAANQSGAQSYVGTVVPTYCISPTLPAASNNTPNYELSSIANRVITDEGQGAGVSRFSSPLIRDWTQQFETKEKTFAANAASTHPWTFEHMFRHCRGQYPFAVVDGFGGSTDEAFFFRTEGTIWRPDRASDGNDAQFHIPFQTYVEAVIT